MAQVKPFVCVRPEPMAAARVASLPYDVYNTKEAKDIIQKEPLSFLKVDRAETFFEDGADPYEERVYEKASKLLREYQTEGVMLKDQQPGFYIYQLTMDGRTQTGIVGCVSIDDYINQTVKTHENTRSEKEQDRIRHVEVCNAQTGPIFLTYRADQNLNQIMDRICSTTPLYDFTSDDGIRHTVWKTSSQNEIEVIGRNFDQIKRIYIADGHHRAAAAVKVGLKRRQLRKVWEGPLESDFFLAVLFPDDQLKILPYNRCLTDLNGYSEDAFIEKVKETFDIRLIGEQPYEPKKKGEFGMYLDNQWYCLTLKDTVTVDQDAVSLLDVSILHRYLIEPVLGISDPKVDQRIDFIGGIRGLKELERRVHADMKIAFSMYPTAIDEVFAVSDADCLMPPKSTWFEPKLRSGLFVHELE